MGRLVFSISTSFTRRHLWQTVFQSVPRHCPCLHSSDARSINSIRSNRNSSSLSTFYGHGHRLRSSSRRLSTGSSSSSNIKDEPPPSRVPHKQLIFVWEQTISSSHAGASAPSDSIHANGKEIIPKGRVLYRPVITSGQNNDKSMGWEVATIPESTDMNSSKTKPSSSSFISSTINSYKSKDLTNIHNLPFIHHFLPARYPHSVCPSYASYASYCFLGSIAGSSAMVLSTQALLIAVGVGTQSAAPMAAALNWVMKDGVGQLGGVIFASQLGKGGVYFDYWRVKFETLSDSSFGGGRPQDKRRGNYQRGTADTNPKRWRMVAALALDLSTLLEICTPLMGPEFFLPCASVANIGKNVGFLAASASRAAIHQSLSMGGSSEIPVSVDSIEDTCTSNTKDTKSTTTSASSSNLGDVTAKSGSQAIVASLLGTAIGIFLSRTFCSDHGTAGILAGFVVLSAVHQVCTYKAIKSVPLRNLDRHRLHIVLASYIAENCDLMRMKHNNETNSLKYASRGENLMTPAQVADKESFLPMTPPDDSVRWLNIGDSLMGICPSGCGELEALLLPANANYDENHNKKISSVDDRGAFDAKQYEKYILNLHPPSIPTSNIDGMAQLTFFDGATDNDLLRGMFHAYTAHIFMQNIDSNPNDGSYNGDSMGKKILFDTHCIMSSQMPIFINHLRGAGWQIGTGFVNVECGSSHRLKIQTA